MSHGDINLSFNHEDIEDSPISNELFQHEDAQDNSHSPQLEQKVPKLLTNAKIMYDLSSYRAKKRLDQMKKRKDILDSPDEKGKAMAIGIASELSNAFDKESENKLRNLPIKTFQDDNPNQCPYKNQAVDITQEENMSESLENPLNEKISEAEVVVSDLECNYEEDNQDSNSLNTNTKYFIPISNSLRYKKEVSTDKATPSYLMALFQDEEENSNEEDYASLISKCTNSLIPLKNKKQKNSSKNLNYAVDEIIEEESDTLTENESERKKGSGFFRNTLKSSSNWRSGSFGFCQSDNPYPQSTRLLSSDELYCTGLSLFKLNTFNQKFTKVFHKSSKSDMIDIYSVLQKIQLNLQTKLHSKSEEKIKKLQERKSLLVENFLKSKSYENMPTYSDPAQPLNAFQKFLFAQQSLNSNKEKSSSTPKELKECCNSEEDRICSGYKVSSQVEENCEDGLAEINNSMIEIKEKDEVNFEQELNLQLEKNNIKEIEAVKKANDHIPDTPSHFLVTKPLLEVSSPVKLQILNEKGSRSVFTNNYINNNINNISISIISTPGYENKEKPTRIQNYSITHDIRKKYLQTKAKAQSISVVRQIEALDHTRKLSMSSSKISLFTNDIKIKCNKKTPGRTSPKRLIPFAKDLKQYLIYNDNVTASTNARVYSETSVHVPSMQSMSNKKIIFDAIRTLKFPFSSLDHQKFSFEKLEKSKGNFFCLLINKDSSNRFYVIYKYDYCML